MPQEEVPSGPLDLTRCAECGLAQLGHNFPPNLMYGLNYGYRSGLNATMVDHLRRKAEWLESLVMLKPGDAVLDIGCNDGTLLAAYRTLELSLLGIDPTADKFSRFHPDGMTYIADFFNRTSYSLLSDQPAKLVTSVAMFYDLEDPVAFARDVAACLAPDGLWHFEQSYLPSMLRTGAYDAICHEHLEFYSLASVIEILRRADLKAVKVGFNNINGGSFSVTAAHIDSAVEQERHLIDWLLKQEARLGLASAAPYDVFRERVGRHREDLSSLLTVLRDGGARVYGYGASTKGNVLLQYCKIGADLLAGIADVNPEKHGRVTPGSNIPILSEEDVRAMKPDYLLVLPWHFRDGIVRREREFLQNGGRLIFPLPEIEIVGD